MSRLSLRLALSALLAMSPLAPAFAQKTRAQLNTEVGTTFPDQTTGQITPAGVRAFQNDVINSIMPVAPVGNGNFATFDGTTGLLKDSGISPSSQFIANANIIPGQANTVKGSPTNGAVEDIQIPDCSVALTYNTTTHAFGCGSSGTVFVVGTPTANQLARWSSSTQIQGVDFGTVQLTSAHQSTSPANPTGTTSTAGAMMGLGATCKITPATSGRVRFTIIGSVTNNNAPKNTTVGGRYGTGAAPSNGAALTGFLFNAPVVYTTSGAGALSIFPVEGIASGLTVGVPVWYDASVATNDAGTTSSISNLTCLAQEF